MQIAISISKLVKQYPNNEHLAIDHLNLNIQKGIITGLLGPNGAGKTSTISILCGLTTMNSGEVHILGKNCKNEISEIKKLIGIVPQQIALYPQLTAVENLKYIGRLYNIPKTILNDKIQSLLEKFDLQQHGKKKINQFSGGMKRRTNIIAGLLHDPEILILDEPTAGVDVQSRAMIIDFLLEYNLNGKTILYTSHALEEAEKICNDIAIIDQGKLIVQSDPQSLLNNLPHCNNLEDVFLHYTGRKVRE